MSWVLTISAIMALIVLHELGHFTAAKAVGMRVERFSLFFGPMFVKFQRGETLYGIGVIPLGGYVKISGMNPEEIKDLHPDLARRAYYAQAPWRRIVVILAGPAVNIMIAFLLFWAILFSGSLSGLSTLENLNPSLHTRVPTSTVHKLDPGMPADGILRIGDRIVAVEGRPVTVAAAQRAIEAHRCSGPLTEGCRALTPVQLTVRRDGETLKLSVYPRYSKEYGKMLVGFDFGEAGKHYGVFSAAGTAIHEMWSTTTSMLSNIGKAFTSSKVRHQFHSIIGVTEIAHETVVAGAGYALVFIGFFSLVLAVLNLFPFLPLDGGHILWALAEKVRGKRISVIAMWRFSSVGIVLLLFLVANGISNDISHLAG
jgi:regulator of sigma E protease